MAVGDTQPAESGWAQYRRLLRYAQPHWKLFAFSALVMVVYGATDAMFAGVMEPMLDESFVAKDPDMIRMVPLILIGIFFVRGIAGFVSTYGMSWIGRSVIQELRREMFAKVLSLPSRYYDERASSELVSGMIYNVEQVAVATTNAVTILIRDTFTIIFLIGLMFYKSGWLAMMFLLIGPVMAFFIRFVSRRFRSISTRIQGSMSDVTQVVEEVVVGQRVVKTFGGQDYEKENFEAINRKNRSLHMKMIATSAASVPIVQFMGAATLALVIYLATQQSMQDNVTAGEFVSFITAMLLLMPPLKRLTSVNSSLQRGIAAAESIFALLDTESERDTGNRTLARAQGDISFQDVNFEYRAENAQVLKDINFDIKPGETLAIVGRSGSGKSTLVNLLPRLYDPSSGIITLDGCPLEEYRLADLRRQIAVVGQEVILFNDTVARNIAYGTHHDPDMAEVEQAAIMANAYDFIMDLPQGFETPVGEKGSLLSGGQRQRIAIARALLKDAPILILDEATSALDTESERAIQVALDTLMQGRTTLVIAHRLSTVENADRILVMDQGRVIEYGRHEELMAREGHYSALYRMQFSDSLPV